MTFVVLGTTNRQRLTLTVGLLQVVVIHPLDLSFVQKMGEVGGSCFEFLIVCSVSCPKRMFEIFNSRCATNQRFVHSSDVRGS